LESSIADDGVGRFIHDDDNEGRDVRVCSPPRNASVRGFKGAGVGLKEGDVGVAFGVLGAREEVLSVRWGGGAEVDARGGRCGGKSDQLG
jgi:hypothetical protein